MTIKQLLELPPDSIFTYIDTQRLSPEDFDLWVRNFKETSYSEGYKQCKVDSTPKMSYVTGVYVRNNDFFPGPFEVMTPATPIDVI